LIQVDVPAWNNGKTPSPFPASNGAEVIVVSSCGWSMSPNKVHFDIVVPSPPDTPKTDLDKQFEVLKNLAELKQPSQFLRFAARGSRQCEHALEYSTRIQFRRHHPKWPEHQRLEVTLNAHSTMNTPNNPHARRAHVPSHLIISLDDKQPVIEVLKSRVTGVAAKAKAEAVGEVRTFAARAPGQPETHVYERFNIAAVDLDEREADQLRASNVLVVPNERREVQGWKHTAPPMRVADHEGFPCAPAAKIADQEDFPYAPRFPESEPGEPSVR
jgi:hypothetical protein